MENASLRSFARVPFASRVASAYLLAIVFVGCASAVGPGNGATDSGSGADASALADTAPTDAATRDTVDADEEDSSALPPCDPGAIVDLNARGTLVGNVTRYVGSNVGAAVDGVVYVTSQSETTFAPVVHRYTPRHTTRLLLRVIDPAPPESFHGRVWILDRCTSMQTTLLYDSDPSSGGYDGPSLDVHAGVPIFIAVAGFNSRLTAPYELSVTELDVVPVGGVCSLPPHETDACTINSTCETDDPRPGRCVANGSDGRPCRVEGPACDDGLACGWYDGSGPRCGPAHGVGGRCFPGVCIAGTYCQGGTCLAYGALEQNCREQQPACDDGLICVGYACHAPALVGEMCLEGTGWGPKCVAGLSCVNRVCVLDGSRGAACRTNGTPCDGGLGCVPDTLTGAQCLPLTTLGGDCSASSCPGGSHCERGRCVADGIHGGACRDGADPCDAGLACVNHWYLFPGVMSDFTLENTCQPVHEGDHCEFFARLGCPRGTWCAGSSTATATCMRPTGRLGEPCRMVGTACNAGLFCQRWVGGGWLAPTCQHYE